jgi:predicted RecB family nuclease
MIRLSKSRVMAGLQCHKLLWWTVHERDAPELEPEELVQAWMDRGTRITEIARTYVPGGVLIDLPYNAYDERVTQTRRALADGAPAIYEASFRADGVFVAVDILTREGAGFRLTEVKSTARVKDSHISDVAVQAHVLRQSGLNVVGTEVMHLNRACTYPDLSNLFVRADVTDATRVFEESAPRWISEQMALLRGPLPEVPIGTHCRVPYDCPFMERCWPTLPPHHVSTLYAMKLPRIAELDGQGYRLIAELPDDVQLGSIQERQRRAVREDRIIVEPELAEALKVFVPPIAFLDFETVGLAVPIWNGCHPYDFVPVQFSCHVQDADGHVIHHEWLADGADDPRPRLAQRLVEACGSARTVVAYYASFERRCIEQLAEVVPALARELHEIANRLVDLLPIVRNYVYHLDFGGGFGLKSVLPALVPELRYDDLPIGDGGTATLELERLLFDAQGMGSDAREKLRGDLLRYCHQDTLGLVELLKRLRQVIVESPVTTNDGREAHADQ